MPNKDGTGPMGKGPMTGRGEGPCNKKSSNSIGREKGRGLGRGNRGRMNKSTIN
ncbi:DUF5320 domain-containing protein [Candidatus Peregrinibacteria bacterium]|nr:DUF5320 domain-containing protein [Candidatus Peregrinibacteria bacterium]